MKIAVVLFAIIGLGLSAPQPRKLFHEHFDDFMAIIGEEVGEDLRDLMEQYVEYDEFWATFNYITTKNFKDLVYEMEHLPEFQAVIDYLENDNIDIHFFLDRLDEMLDNIQKRSRAGTSGKDFTSYIEDCIALFPKDKLSALFDQKIAEDEAFALAIANLKSPEWKASFDALVNNDVFKAEVDALAANGIDIHLLFHEVMAIFGQ